MSWIIFAVLQIWFILSGVRSERRAGLWSNSKFLFALGFAALEFCIVFLPVYRLTPASPHAAAIVAVCFTIGGLNFIWFIIACRRWRLPDGRTSLQAWHDAHDPDPSLNDKP